MPKIFISNFPFARESSKPLDILNKTGWDIKINTLNRKLKSKELIDYALDCEGLIAGTENLEYLIEKSVKLRIISRIGIGLDSVPLKLCKDKGIMVTYTPDAVTDAVVEFTIGLMISLTRHIVKADSEIRKNIWIRHMGKRIEESVIGIIGLGRVGTKVCKYLLSFKPMQVLVNDIKDKSKEIETLRNKGLNILSSSKDEIYKKSDIISIHTPLTHKTKNMISTEEFNLMSKNTFLINTARGGIIDEHALYSVLEKNQIAGAAMDVFENEPYHDKLCELKNIILTQHMGSFSYDCRMNMELQASEAILDFFNGRIPKNVVPEEEYGW